MTSIENCACHGEASPVVASDFLVRGAAFRRAASSPPTFLDWPLLGSGSSSSSSNRWRRHAGDQISFLELPRDATARHQRHTAFILPTSDPNLQKSHLHEEEDINGQTVTQPCQRWQVSQGLHDLVKFITDLHRDKFPWMGGLGDPPLKAMAHEDWEELKKIQAGFQQVSTDLAERMYMPYKGPCVDTDPGPVKPLGKNVTDKQGNEIEETPEGKANLDVMAKVDKATGRKEELKEIEKKQKDDPYCLKPFVMETEAKTGKGKGKGKPGTKQDERQEAMKNAFQMLNEDPARFFATVPEADLMKFKPLVQRLRKITLKELPNATDEDADKPPIDGATRHRYELTMQEMRDLADRTMVDMMRCLDVRPSYEILSIKEGSKAQNIRMGLQDNTMVYEKELGIFPKPPKEKPGFVQRVVKKVKNSAKNSSCAIM